MGCVLGHFSIMQPPIQRRPYPHPFTMPSLYQTVSKKTVSQQEFLSSACGVIGAGSAAHLLPACALNWHP
jgi:hypothetical protein